ncbi:MAG: DNA gyrase subunit A [Patescibacteria group bacterium]|nr:DNA gyrase subunit A [Patescibacteria group bacterium]
MSDTPIENTIPDSQPENNIEAVETTPVQPLEKGMIPYNITDFMEKSYLTYAMSVIVSRALPDVRDGLKPVHRRIMYAMLKLGLRSNTSFKKSARIVGDVIGKYHPHGDSSVYEAMVRLAQDFSVRYMLVDGQGNFGSIDGDSAAAYRYTEARMKRISEELIGDLDKDTIDFRDNFDGSLQEPSVLPAKVPNLLLNGITGIAVGMATNIPPHHLGEVVDACQAMLANKDVTVEDLMEHIQGPDFPTGGVVYDRKAMLEAYSTGRGRVVMRAKTEIEEDKKGRYHIIITEIPYQVCKANLVKKIADLVIDKKLMGISDIRDESNRKGMRVVIDLKKDAFPKKIINQLFSMTELQKSFNYNMVALVDRGTQPKLLNLQQLIHYFLEHRFEVVTRRTEFELKIAQAREHILQGLKIALDNIDEIIALIRGSKTKEDAKAGLMTTYKLSDLQAQAILDMRLQTLAGLERQKIEDELLEKLALIAEFEGILADPAKIREIISTELTEVKERYNDARRTEVVPYGLTGFSEEDFVANEATVITMTQAGYIKRVAPDTYRAQKRGGKGVVGMKTKEEDNIARMLITNTHDDILFFTNAGRVFKLRAYEIPEGSRTTKGVAVVNIIQLEADEKVTAMLSLGKDNAYKYLFMATSHGTVKKTKLEDFSNVRRSGLIAIKLKPGESLNWVEGTIGEDSISMVTEQGMAIHFSEEDVRSMGRTASGVRGIRLK